MLFATMVSGGMSELGVKYVNSTEISFLREYSTLEKWNHANPLDSQI